MSSKIFTEVLKRFKSFTPLELKALSIVFNTFVQHNEFNLDDLVKAKHDDNGIKCPHCSHAGPEGIVKYGKRVEALDLYKTGKLKSKRQSYCCLRSLIKGCRLTREDHGPGSGVISW